MTADPEDVEFGIFDAYVAGQLEKAAETLAAEGDIQALLGKVLQQPGS